MYITFYFILFSLLPVIFSVNILYLDHCASPSHHFWNKVLAYNLAKKGYNVTIVTHTEEKAPPENYHTILLEGVYEKLGVFNLDHVSQLSDYEEVKVVYEWSYNICKMDLATKGLKTLVSYPEDFKFDLIIYDITAGYCLYPLIDRFKRPPVLGVTVFLLPPAAAHVLGHTLNPSYSPLFMTKYADKMSFFERFRNFYLTYLELFYRKYFGIPQEEQIAREYFGKNIRPLAEIERDISLLLANTDPNLGYPVELPPNIIPVGGLQITPAKPLPEDLRKIVENAKDGVILFTLGSNLRSDQLGEEKRQALIKAFEKLPQTILWKFETDNVKDFPKNVVVRKWLPQSDILAHPNTKLFITHGGGLGTQEAMYHGVPVVAIPFFIDHIANSQKLVNKKMGISVEYQNLEKENLYETIREVIENPIYRTNSKIVSKRYRDQPQTPLERATFWVDYMLRHGTAEHLNLAARDMPLYQMSYITIFEYMGQGFIPSKELSGCFCPIKAAHVFWVYLNRQRSLVS